MEKKVIHKREKFEFIYYLANAKAVLCTNNRCRD